jgi:hypothetical protein
MATICDMFLNCKNVGPSSYSPFAGMVARNQNMGNDIMVHKSLKSQTKFSMVVDFFIHRKKKMSTWKNKIEVDYKADLFFLASFFSSFLDTLMLVIPNM